MIREEQFVRLFVRHESELRVFAMTLFPNAADAEDVVQDACVAMWKRIGDLKSEESFRAWAYTFVRFTALNKLRKQKRSPLVFSEDLMQTLADEGESEMECARAELRALTSCLEKIPEAQRDLLGRYYRSTSVKMEEIAKVIQRSVGGLYKSLERIRDTLKVCNERRMADEGFEISKNKE